jgi:VanZ family protein
MWMGAIFMFSTSLFGSEATGSVLEPLVRYFFPSVSQGTLDAVHFLVRKAAHMTEYAVLALLWYRALRGGASKGAGRAAALAFVISALYAASDEFHQSFVPNRTPSAYDVLVDASGAAIAMGVLLAAIKKGASSGAPNKLAA